MAVKFGLALDFQSATRTLDQQLDRYLELIRLAEGYGFDSVTAGEGYSVRPDWGHLPSPLLALAALARETPLKLGTGVTLIPTWHPLQLAYDSAVLDQITGGRFILGVGLGGPALARRFGVDPAILGDYMDDTLAILRALWAGEDGYRGKALSVERGIGIRPIQPAGPVLWVGGAIRRSAERAARWGDGWIASSSYSFDQVAVQAQRYRAALVAQGKVIDAAALNSGPTNPTPGPPFRAAPSPSLSGPPFRAAPSPTPSGPPFRTAAVNATPVVVANRITLLAETDTEARRDARKFCGAVLERYARMGGIPWDASGGADLFEGLEADRCLIGTPEQVIARVERYAQAGVTHIQARVSLADCPQEIAARSIELLGRSVLPEFQKALPHPPPHPPSPLGRGGRE